MEQECSWEDEAVSVSPELTYSGVSIRTRRQLLDLVVSVASWAAVGRAVGRVVGRATAGIVTAGVAIGGVVVGRAAVKAATLAVGGIAVGRAVGRAAVKAAALAEAALDLEVLEVLEAFLAEEARVEAIVEV